MANNDADPPAAKPRLTGVAAKAQEAVQAVASRRGDVVLLRDLAHQAQITEALTRSELTEALSEALAGREAALVRAREAAAARHFAGVKPRPLRRHGRLDRAIDRGLAQLGAWGQSLVIRRAGLWRSAAAVTLFDAGWYLAANPEVAGASLAPLAHYLIRGGAAGFSPHPLFNAIFYARANGADLRASGVTPLEHFLRDGAPRGRDPHALFDIAWYVGQGATPSEGEDPVSHYVRAGWREGLSPSPLFDPAWYRHQMPSQAAEVPPLVHYVTTGWRQGLTPHPLFDPAWYLEQYPDIAEAGFEPLAHFLSGGAAEGRSPGPWFDLPAYVAARGDRLDPAVNPLADYLRGGAWAVAESRPGFPTAAYLAANPDLVRQGITPLEHWARKTTRP